MSDQRLLQWQLSTATSPDGEQTGDPEDALSQLAFSFASPEMVPDPPSPSAAAVGPPSDASGPGESAHHGGNFSRRHLRGASGLEPEQERVRIVNRV